MARVAGWVGTRKTGLIEISLLSPLNIIWLDRRVRNSSI